MADINNNNKAPFHSATICTLNCEGVNRSSAYMSQLLNNDNVDFLCLQETWLLNCNMEKLSSIHDNYLFAGVSGIDSNKDILVGRPYGGVAILYNKMYANYVTVLKTGSRRLCAIKLCLPSGFSCILISVYLPCDTYSNTASMDYLNSIDAIEQLITGDNYSSYIIAGDFNTCFDRKNAHTLQLNNFIDRNDMYVSWNYIKSQKDFTYILILH